MNSNYIAGRNLEYLIMRLWEDRGYECTRASGSHSSYDVIAYCIDRKPEMIQCKRVTTKTEANRLLKQFKEVTKPSLYYHQSMAVKVKGSTEIISVTV